MYWCNIIHILNHVERYERVGIFYTVNEVASSLNHTLINELLERLFLNAESVVEQEFVPETAVDEVTCCMLCTPNVEVNVLPVVLVLLRNDALVVARIHIAQVVSR